MEHLRLRQFLAPGHVFHIARGVYGPGEFTALHRHDFAEVFWIEAGRCIHLINGRRQTLEAGDLLLMRPADAHELRGGPPDGMTLVNLAFDRRVIGVLRRRYFEQDAWPWQGAAVPARHRIEPTLA
ncbi:MAG: AraC family ligand binding domain-containing protein, partial [Phycisphaeraceae bacterium]